MSSYDQRWRAYRFWNRIGAIAVFALAPVTAFGVFLAHSSGDIAAMPYLLALMWLVAAGGTLYRIRTFRCPRCGKNFSVESWWAPRSRGRKCVHCALDLDAAPG